MGAREELVFLLRWRSGGEFAAAGRHLGAVVLYRRLLGAAWETLHPAVRRLHDAGMHEGTFRVRRGRGSAARILGCILGLPPAAESVPVRLTIVPEGRGERWRRCFGTARLDSVQSERGGLLVERMGAVEMMFRLEARDGELHFRHLETRLVLPVPPGLAPRVHARVAGGACAHVQVRVECPGVGLLAEYEGDMQ